MKCPKCDGKTIVTNSRPSEKKTIRRRRECMDCGYRFTTYEITEVLKDRYENAEKTLEKAFG